MHFLTLSILICPTYLRLMYTVSAVQGGQEQAVLHYHLLMRKSVLTLKTLISLLPRLFRLLKTSLFIVKMEGLQVIPVKNLIGLPNVHQTEITNLMKDSGLKE